MARRCDNTVKKKQVNSCVLKHLFMEGLQLLKTLPTSPENTFSDALLMLIFSKLTPTPQGLWCKVLSVGIFWICLSRGLVLKVFTYIYVHMYEYIYMYINMYIYRHIYIYIYMYICLYICVYMYTIRPKKARYGTGATGGVCQTLSDLISQLFSPPTLLAHWGCSVKFWTRLTSPNLTLLLVFFVGPQENTFLARKCSGSNDPPKTPHYLVRWYIDCGCQYCSSNLFPKNA